MEGDSMTHHALPWVASATVLLLTACPGGDESSTQRDAAAELRSDAGDNPFYNATDSGPPPFFLTWFGYEATTCMGGQLRYTSTVPATCVLRYGRGEEGGPDEVMCDP